MAGQLWGWGSNAYGTVGDNTTANKSSPVQTITFASNWVSLSQGKRVTAGIKTDGTLWLWGRNSFGTLGDNTTISKSSPVQTIALGTNWSQVAVGYYHVLATKTDGSLWSWGLNSVGQIGDNTTINKSSPVQVLGSNKNWSYISAGDGTSVGIKTDGTLWCWGLNYSGVIGDNSTIDKSSPVQTVAGGFNWVYASAGFGVNAGIKSDGTLWIWGTGNSGVLGDNTIVKKSSPIQTISGGNNWSKVACGTGGFQVAAIKLDGTLWTWGQNSYGVLGNNSTSNISSPIQTIAGGTTWKNVALGYGRMIASKTDGSLWSWGANYSGQLGDNTITSKSSPIQTVMGGTRWSNVSAMSGQAAAIYENDANQLGINTQPLAGYNSNQLLVQPKININDSAGAVVRIANNSVTVAVQSGTAILSGTTTVTAVNGVATFTDLVLTGSGNITLRFTSAGLTQVDSSSFTVSLTLPIIPKRSEVSDRIPTSGQLNIGELAINIEDKKGYVKKSDGTILNIFNGEIADGGTF